MHASRSLLPLEKIGDYEARVAEWGEYIVYFEHIPAGTDLSAYYETCECPHLGYVFSGKIRFVYRDGREEIVSAGEMYYVTPGHSFHVIEDTDTVEFSPAGRCRERKPRERIQKDRHLQPFKPAPRRLPQEWKSRRRRRVRWDERPRNA